ncbi:lysozyme [Methylobacterium sp. HMF5984]|uniref:lysozyme n=1 Tax=Methylobacterium sp. HMF5984 TaxID=3367370 RepID=UPI003852BBF5
MRTSTTGIDLIKSFEHMELTAYKCPAGVWTLGYGTTSGIKPGMTCTEAQAIEMFKKDLIKFENGVNQLVKVALNQNQFDALVSFAYNCGEHALGGSTLLKKVNAGDYTGASKEFGKWNKGGGKILAGLTRRRAAESKLFETPVDGASKGFFAKLLGR